MPVLGPLVLIRQNQQQTPVVESLLNIKLNVGRHRRPRPKSRLLRVGLNSHEGEVFIKACLSESFALYMCHLSWHLVHIQVSYLANWEHDKLCNILYNCRTALHISWLHWFSLVRHIFELAISNFFSVLLYFAGIIVQVIEQVSVLLINIIIFSFYIKGKFTMDLYELILSDIYTPVTV